MHKASGYEILYVGDNSEGATSRDRAEALIRNGHSVTIAATDFPRSNLGRLDRKISSLIQHSATILRVNEEILRTLRVGGTQILWVDKGWMIFPSTLHAAKRAGATNVLFNNDNPWGLHEQGKWRHLFSGLRYYDEVFSPRTSTDALYKKGGALNQTLVDFGYDPIRHRPHDDVEKIHDISFIGTALPDGGNVRPHRADVIIKLMERQPGRVSIFGHGWIDALGRAAHLARIVGPPQMGDEYARTISKSRINLSFVTHDNNEESSHKAFEIAACGGVLLAERSERLAMSFSSGTEAVYFNSDHELFAEAERLLGQPERRKRLGFAARERAVASGYDNDSRLARAFLESKPLQKVRKL